MKFKNYNKSSTVGEEGFEVRTNDDLVRIALSMSQNLEKISTKVKNTDVFRTKLGDIKQIQNLHQTPLMDDFIQECIDLLGAEEYEVLNSQYFCKPPNYKMTSAHQDNAYFESTERVYTFWMPLQDVDILNSCMFYVPGSHKKGLVEHSPIGTNTRVRTGTKGVSMYSSYYKNKDFVKVPMKRGEILIHDKDCMHFSSPNLSDNYRIAVTCIIKIK